MRSSGVYKPKIEGIEAARGLAAVLVVLYHAARHVAQYSGELPFGNFSAFGHAGVDFFFVLSGFIIVFVHGRDIGQPSRAGRYLQRRLTRILPLYWVALATETAILALSPTREVPSPGLLLLNASLFPIDGAIVGVAWTLHLEMLFYAVFLVLILNRTIGAALLVAWACLAASSLFGERDWGGEPLDSFASSYCVQFFMGMAAAWFVRRAAVPWPRLLLLAGVSAFLLAGTLQNLDVMDGYAAWPARVAYGLSAMVALVGIVGSEAQGRLRVPPVLAGLGDASYAIYLFHLVAIGMASQVFRALGLRGVVPAEAQYVVLVAAGIVGGIVISRLVEKPLLALVRRLVTGRGEGLVVATAGR